MKRIVLLLCVVAALEVVLAREAPGSALPELRIATA